MLQEEPNATGVNPLRNGNNAVKGTVDLRKLSIVRWFYIISKKKRVHESLLENTWKKSWYLRFAKNINSAAELVLHYQC